MARMAVKQLHVGTHSAAQYCRRLCQKMLSTIFGPVPLFKNGVRTPLLMHVAQPQPDSDDYIFCSNCQMEKKEQKKERKKERNSVT
jgi:hypothetical protein